ncbi:unnamed protein product [Mytilus coruscus]|uniref:ECM4 n=1 Tax=Mytilus coruscus TaxID=42192 RepID=A0A6J8CDC6_MYTCO|nr:unnamed protein product [Mytilus coruscus]CAC5393229.1 ECM4 [Mytilus coruscus]CAC5393230.1 unnamed protein product [Mytilus coruscus]
MSRKLLHSVTNTNGAFVRSESKFRNFITADGSSGFPAEAYRYHLYVSLACPWAHRALIVRSIKGLEDIISCSVVDWFMTDKGWNFTDKKDKCTLDTVNGKEFLRQVYEIASPNYDGRTTVPLLWDKTKKTAVNNESSEIIRMLNSEFNTFCPTKEQSSIDLYPEKLRPQIDDVNSWIYTDINNGVYKSGFARTQEAYDSAVTALFKSLDRVEDILSKSRYLVGDQLTEADIRLFPTLVRFDAVYHGHFKCNKKRIIDYPNMWKYTRDIYQTNGVSQTVDMYHIKWHYMYSHESINPYRIISVGPDLDISEPHGREKMKS